MRYAITGGYVEIVKVLIELGADIHIQNRWRTSPMAYVQSGKWIDTNYDAKAERQREVVEFLKSISMTD